MVYKESFVFNKLFEIENDLSKFQFSDISLLNGLMGQAIFYDNLHDLTNDDVYLDKCHALTEVIISKQFQQEIGYSFSKGFTGIAWGLNHLSKRQTLNFNGDSFFNSIDEYIYKISYKLLKGGHYDYLHGGMGAALYACSRLPNEKAQDYLRHFIQYIDDIKITDENGIKWNDLFTERAPGCGHLPMYNLGLSHGIPSIVNILLKLFKQGLFLEKIYPLIDGSLQWIMKQKNKTDGHLSIYPTCSIDSTNSVYAESRLGWCYGDLGLAWMFLKAGDYLKKDIWRNEAMLLITSLLKRKDPLDNPNLDAGFCHGTSGIAYLFKRLYQETSIQDCLNRHYFWIEETFKQAKFDDGLAGFKTYNLFAKKIWERNAGLLEGVTGVGLVLINYINDSKEWDECLLLSL